MLIWETSVDDHKSTGRPHRGNSAILGTIYTQKGQGQEKRLDKESKHKKEGKAPDYSPSRYPIILIP